MKPASNSVMFETLELAHRYKNAQLQHPKSDEKADVDDSGHTTPQELLDRGLIRADDSRLRPSVVIRIPHDT